MEKMLALILIPFFSFIPFEVTNTVAQVLPFSQNWSNAGLITTNNNWSAVPGIEGFNGNGLTFVTGTDPQTIVGTGFIPALVVIANQSDPNNLTTGGLAEFDGIANPSIALQPNAADNAPAPYLIISLNTINQQNINVSYNLRDLDGSADNAVQPVALQYRVGNSGNFTNIPGGFVADATTGPNLATLVTAVNAVLPNAANNLPLVQVRIITADAVSNDEWVGVDDINITSTVINPVPVVTTTPGTTTYIYNTPVVIDNGLTVSDANNTTLASGSVSIGNGFQPATDVLLFTAIPATMGNISGSYSAGTLSLNSAPATATVAEWQVALRSIRFSASSSPANHNVTINFTVNDGTSSSAIVSRAVAVYASAPPVVTTTGGNTTYVHSTPVIIDNGIMVSDANNSTLSSTILSISSGFQPPNSDVLSFTNDGTTMGNIIGNYSTPAGVLSLTSAGATATLTQWQSALRSITFYISGTVGLQDRVINFVANDGSNASLPGTKTITISPGTAPVVTTTAGNKTYSHGTPVVIDNGLTVTDTDSPTPPSASVRITTGFEIGNDYLSFTNDGITMGNLTGGYTQPTGILNLNSAGSTATLAQWQAALRSITYYNSSAVPQAQNRVISFTVNDGATNSNVATKTITYMPLANIEFSWSPPLQLGDPISGNGGWAGTDSKLLVVNGNPAIAFFDELRGNLLFVRSIDVSGTNYGRPVTIDSIGVVGRHISLQIVNGNPAISYFDGTNGDLKYVRATDPSGTAWGTPISIDVTDYVGEYTSLQIVNGNPAISYLDGSYGDLKYVRATDASGTAWGTPIRIDVMDYVGLYTSLQVVNGNPAISYYDLTNGNLKFALAQDASGTAWGTPLTLDITGDVGRYSSLQVVNGNPAISYYDKTLGDLKYLRATNTSGTAWGIPIIPVSIDVTGDVGAYTSLQIVSGNPAVSYYNTSSGDLKYVRATDAFGTAWGTPISIDVTGIVGQFTSLQIVNGNPAIAYFDSTNHDLKYVRASNALGTIWGYPLNIDVPGEIGTNTSLQLVNGNPAISYYDGVSGGLQYLRATDPSGSAWATPVILDITGYPGFYNSLQVVNGNPAVSYYDYINKDLKYIRATDPSGTAWGTPLSIDVTGDVGLFTSLQVVNGNPAISYFDATNKDLKYVRATDPSGTAWGTPLSIDVTGEVGSMTFLQVVNGNPAVSYFDQTNGDLKYVRATNASGTAWGTPLSIDVTGEVGRNTSLQIVNGNPAISYIDYTNHYLKYIRATDASGTAWGTPASIDITVAVGNNTSLKIVTGNPAISYRDITNNHLKYIRATDASGTAWGTPTTLDAAGPTGEYASMVGTAYGAAIAYYSRAQLLPFYISGKIGYISQPSHYFRSKQNGNWNDPDSWESSPDNANWGPATLTPDYTANIITVKNGHTITVTANVTVDQLVIEPGSYMIIKTGTIFTVK